MPRVHFVKKARKDNPAVKQGEPYFWWKFRYGGKRYSKTRPRPSQLTQSPYFSALRSIVESIQDASVIEPDDWDSLKEQVVSQLQDLRDETEESKSNMPDSLQESPTGELLQERIDALENAESCIESIAEFDFETEEFHEIDFDEEEIPEAREEHEEQEEQRCKDEFESWAEEAVGELTSYVEECEV